MRNDVHKSTLSPNRWRELRLARGVSLRCAASRASIDPGHLSRVERGQAQFSVRSAARLARVLDLDLGDLGWLFGPGDGEE